MEFAPMVKAWFGPSKLPLAWLTFEFWNRGADVLEA